MRLQHPARVASEEQGLGPRISSTEAPPTDWRADRTWDQKSAEDDLSRYPFRLEVRGAPRSLVWPDICANCGGAATERIRIRRAFYRRGRGRRYAGWFGYRVVSADVPFCGSCAARHRATVPRVSWLRRYRWFLLNPAHIATIGFAVLLAMALPSVLETPIASPGGKVAWGLLGVFIFGIVWTIGVTWWMSRPDRFEPRSEVTMACAISHDVAQFFEGRRHVYGFRNQPFGEAFERTNQARIWTEREQARMWKTSLVAAILLIAALGGARLLLWYYQGR
jgi:hypothetical protein